MGLQNRKIKKLFFFGVIQFKPKKQLKTISFLILLQLSNRSDHMEQKKVCSWNFPIVSVRCIGQTIITREK